MGCRTVGSIPQRIRVERTGPTAEFSALLGEGMMKPG